MLALAVVLGFAATGLGAYVPMHQHVGVPHTFATPSGIATTVPMYPTVSLYEREPQVAMTLIVAGLIAALIAGVLLFANGTDGSVSSGAKIAITVMAGIILVLHVLAAFAPGMLMSFRSCYGNHTYGLSPNGETRGTPLFQVATTPTLLWLFVGVVVCVGVSYIALMKIDQ